MIWNRLLRIEKISISLDRRFGSGGLKLKLSILEIGHKSLPLNNAFDQC